MSAAYAVSLEPFEGPSYRLPYDYSTEGEARNRAVSIDMRGRFRTIAIIRKGTSKRRDKIVDVYDGRWLSESMTE